MLYNLTREERETIINTTEADDYWDVYTDTAKYVRRLKQYAEMYPDICKLIREDKEVGSAMYRIPKKYWDFRLKKPMSKERREHMAEVARARFSKENSLEKQSKS